MRTLNFKNLWAILSVYECGSAQKSAQILHRTQPAITQSISSFEKTYAAILFERTSKGMRPTQKGIKFCNRIDLAFAHLRMAESLLITQRNRQGLPFHRLVSANQLRGLSALVDTKSFTHAAQIIGMAQPQLHRELCDLQGLCGVPLWVKKGARIETSFEADEISRLGDLCHADLMNGLDELQAEGGEFIGHVRAGALPLARSEILPQAVVSLLAEFPMAHIHIIDGPYEEQVHALRRGQIDFIIGALRTKKTAKDVEQTHLFDDPLSIVMRAQHPLAQDFDSINDKLTSQQLAHLHWILPRMGTPARDSFSEFMAFKGLPDPERVTECSSMVAIRAILLKSDCAALLSARQIKLELELGLLKVMGPPLTGSSRSIGLTMRRGFQPNRLQARLIDYICQSAGL